MIRFILLLPFYAAGLMFTLIWKMFKAFMWFMLILLAIMVA